MAANNIRVKDWGGHNVGPVFVWQTDDRDTSSVNQIEVGEPVKMGGTASQFVIPCVDGDVTIGTDQPLAGISAKQSTETAALNGTVDMYMPLPGMIYEIEALSASAADTQAEIDALRGEYDVLDLTSSKFTLDTAGGSGANNAFLIVGGTPTPSTAPTLDVMIRSDATVFGRAQV